MLKIWVALLAGVMNALSFAPFNWWPLSFLSFGVLFFLWLNNSARSNALIGFMFGLGLFGVGISWMYVSISTFGGMPPILAGVCIAIMVVVMALFPALSGWLQSVFSKWRPSARLSFIIPASWIAFEWVRGWIFTGLPWLSTGYAMLDTPLSNYAPIGGVYLVGSIVVVSVGVVMSFLRSINWSMICLSVGVVGIWLGGWWLNELTWTNPDGGPIRVAIIQQNVSLDDKWNIEKTDEIVNGYLASANEQRDADLIVMPEAAMPKYIDEMDINFWDQIRAHPADFMFGILHREEVDSEVRFYNTIAAVSDKIMIYRKQHLVPFGEYFPMRGLLDPIIKMMNMPMSDFSHWTNPQAALSAADSRFAASICYEDAFPNIVRKQIPRAGAIVNVSEDIWFGDSLAPHQRLQMARFRARESERPMVRASNNGLSAIINWKGGVDHYAPQFVKDVVTGSIQPRTGGTPYVIFGDFPALIMMLLLSLLALVFGRSRVR